MSFPLYIEGKHASSQLPPLFPNSGTLATLIQGVVFTPYMKSFTLSDTTVGINYLCW